jgi:hypothetical protein
MKALLRVHRNRRVSLAGTALAVLLAMFWALTLAASPDLHERVHPDANHEEHDCGAMLFLSGAVGPVLAAVAFALAPPRLLLVRVTAPTLPVVWAVRPADRAVLEHAPPWPAPLAKAI